MSDLITTILSASALLSSFIALIAAFAKTVRWFDNQQAQDDDIKKIKAEQELIVSGVLACLRGLKEQGCDGPVTDAIGKIENHLNKQTHQ